MDSDNKPESPEVNHMRRLKEYLISNFEQFFVLTILLSFSAIMAFVPYKLAFLNFFFLPVLLAAYYLDMRATVLGTVFIISSVFLVAVLYPDLMRPEDSTSYLVSNMMSWAGFLLITAVLVSYLHNRLLSKMRQMIKVTAELTGNKTLLEKTTAELEDYIHNLDFKVDRRTQMLEQNNSAVEEHKQRVEDALFSTMDPVVAKLMIEKRLRTELRRISVQFCDIKNFTGYSERNSAEVVITRLNKHLEEMENTLLDYKAHIDKYLGDGIMSEFGAPNHYEQHALLAVISGIKMQESVERDDSPWKMRIGISTGHAITGLVGHKRQSYTALGDSVNLASRIQELGEPGKVTVDEATYSDTNRFIHYDRKSILSADESNATPLHKTLVQLLNELDNFPEDTVRLMACARIYIQLNDASSSLDLIKQILTIDSEHQPAKLLYAEASLKIDQLDDIAIRGRKQTLHLYEAAGIINPLENSEKIPHHLFEQYNKTVQDLVYYPEDLLLPVECLEGYVGHSRVVGFLSYAIADRLDLPDKDKQDILEAAYLADIGKTIIPHHLLNRRGTLSSEEFESIHKHPRESVRKLRKMGYQSESVFEIIENHHENYDGSGYPAGKAKGEFSIGARIVAVSEAYDSMTSWRPYRESWDNEAALAELERYSARGKFDPETMGALASLVSEASQNVLPPSRTTTGINQLPGH
jgi:putative nucleotidyltransferase with HDIG domain